MRISLGYQVLIAVFLGIFCGIFFGPLCSIVRPVGDVYVMLLQMVALPYICFSLIHGLGSITPETGKKLFKRGWPFWLSLWVIVFAVIYIMSFLIPKPMPAFVGNISLDRDSPLSKNFLNYLVPENPIYDLANNVVPAITVFGLIVGIALMHLESKEPMLSLLDRANQTIEKIFKWLAILSPIGIFAHIAVATGTVYFEDLYVLEFYVVCFILISLFISLWILPALLSSLTPLSYGQALGAIKFICMLPFATALPSIALPFINLYMRKLGEQHAKGDPNFHATSQTVMPICYSFGQIGNCLILFFVLFISFFYRHPFIGMEKAILSVLTVPLSLGSSATSINAVSFLIESLNFPEESIQLYTQTMAITLNFQVLLSMASVLTFIILVLYAYYDLLEVKWSRLLHHLGPAFAILVVAVIGAKEMIRLRDNYQNLYLNLNIEGAIENPVSSKILTFEQPGTPRPTYSREVEPLEAILKGGVLKVGYDPDNIPYCYFNNSQQIVGYDIAFAYELARDLDCTIEFIPLNLDRMGPDLSSGRYDIAMSAIIMNETRILTMDFTHPYTEQDNVLVVRSKDRSRFLKLKEVVQHPNLRIGADGGYVQVAHRHFPLATLVQDKNILQELKQKQLDAVIWSHIPGFVWCLAHPEYTVVDYDGLIGKRYFAYPIPTGSFDWGSFLNNWLILKEQSGFKDRMHKYWIQGESPKTRPPRWSLLQALLRRNE